MFLMIGSTTLDLLQGGIAIMPRAQGDEFTVDSLVFCDEAPKLWLGGNGANSAYVLAKLGAQVALGSAIGCDAAGDILTHPLQTIGVDLRGLLRHPEAATSVTTVISDRGQNRFAFHHAGASHAFAPDDLPMSLVVETTTLLVSSYTLFPRWRPHGVAGLLHQIKAQGGTTALDIGPAIGEPVTLAEIAPMLPTVDYLLGNAHEIAVCMASGTTEAALGTAMAQLLDRGAGCVVIKRGADGALLQGRQDRAALAIPGFPVAATGTVGAGDSFNAGLLYALEADDAPPAAVRFANAVAALVVGSGAGVVAGPTLAQVQTLLGEVVG